MFWSCFHQRHSVKVWIASYNNKALTWEQADRRLFSPSILKTIDVFLTVAFTIISVSHSTRLSLVMKLIFVFSTSLIYDSLTSILQPFSVVDNKMPLLNDQQKKKTKNTEVFYSSTQRWLHKLWEDGTYLFKLRVESLSQSIVLYTQHLSRRLFKFVYLHGYLFKRGIFKSIK